MKLHAFASEPGPQPLSIAENRGSESRPPRVAAHASEFAHSLRSPGTLLVEISAGDGRSSIDLS